jgi:hypothetical protein
LDLLFILNRDTLLVPFVELLNAMRTTLLRVPKSIVNAGRENARRSEPFLVKRDRKPKHVLHHLAQSMGDLSMPFIDLESLRRETRREVKKRWNQYVKSTVQGRQSIAWLLPDGTLKRCTPEESKQHQPDFVSDKQRMNFPSPPAEQASPILNPQYQQLYDYRPSDEESDIASSAVRIASDFFDSSSELSLHPSASPTYPSDSHLSDEREVSASITAPAKVDLDEGFEYLFGGKTIVPSVQHPKIENVQETEEPGSRKVILEWPPRVLEDDLEVSIEGDTSDAGEFRTQIDLIEEMMTSSLEPPTETDLRLEPTSINEVISYPEDLIDDESSNGSNKLKTTRSMDSKWRPGNKGGKGK